MRIAFIEKVIEMAEKDKDLMLVTGDLGFSVFEEFQERFPDQFLNVGVAEQNMVGVAAGLALSGKRPIVYSITTFATMRAYEQIRNDVAYQNLPVIIVGGGSTFSYSTFGCTHMPLEDVAIMRALPNFTVVVPGDPYEVSSLLEQLYVQRKPGYMRIAKRGEPLVHQSNDQVRLGQVNCIKAGSDVTIVASGGQIYNAAKASEFLLEENISARVLSVHTLSPVDEASLVKAARETKGIITCEEHNLTGGLASIVSEVLVRNQCLVPVVSLGVTNEFPKGVGSADYFLAKYNLTVNDITESARSIFQNNTI